MPRDAELDGHARKEGGNSTHKGRHPATQLVTTEGLAKHRRHRVWVFTITGDEEHTACEALGECRLGQEGA